MLDRSLIKQPWVTEKAVRMNAQNKYVFVVKPTATKNEVKKVVNAIYKVDAVSVTIVNRPAKRKGFGKVRGSRPGQKKAYVTLKPGQSITIQ